MTDKEKQTFERLNAVADSIAAACGVWGKAKEQFVNDPSREGQHSFERQCESLNQLIKPYIEDIASATGNSVSNIGCVGAPKDWGDVWFASFSAQLTPDQYLRNVAKYKSFSQQYWADTDRAERCEALLAKVRYATDVVGVETAISMIQRGEVPFIAEKDVARPFPHSPSNFDTAALKAGLLKKYASGPTQLSATADMAMVVVDEHTKKFLIWPTGVAVGHTYVKQYEIQPEAVRQTAADAAYEERRRPHCTPEEVEQLLGTVNLKPEPNSRVLWSVQSGLGLSVPVDFHARFREEGLNVSGSKFPAWRVELTDGLLRTLGEMAYGNDVRSDLQRNYRLEVITLNDGGHDLFIKYQSIIGSRRVGPVPEELVERLYEACKEALYAREAEHQEPRFSAPVGG